MDSASHRSRPVAASAQIMPPPMEAELPQPGSGEEIYTLQTLPDAPGTYWVRETDGQVRKASICSME